MFRVLFSCLLACFLMGCKQTTTEYSAVMREEGVVRETIFTPASHSTDIEPTMDFDGNVGIAVVTSTIPDKYAIIFHCEHDVDFIIQGSDIRYKVLWTRMSTKINQPVTIFFREIYRVTREKGQNTRYELVKLDFVDAE